MRCIFFIFCAVVLSVPAYAANQEAVCRILEREASVAPAAYVPGVDVNGKAVAPTDINAAPQIVDEVITVPLSVDLARRVVSLTQAGALLEAPLGMIEIHQDGTVRYNEQDWTAPIKTLCGHSLKEIEPAATEVSGQGQTAPVKSQSEPMEATETVQVEPPVVQEEELKIISNRPDIVETIEGGEYRENLYE